MVQKDFLLDFDLYICERFGYRNSLHVTQTMNGFCVDVNIKPRKTLHPFLGVQQWRGRFSRLVHHPCALQLCQKTGTRNCRNLCGSSRSMRHNMGTSISGLRITLN